MPYNDEQDQEAGFNFQDALNAVGTGIKTNVEVSISPTSIGYLAGGILVSGLLLLLAAKAMTKKD